MAERLKLRRLNRLFAKLSRIIVRNVGAITFGLAVGFFLASVASPNPWIHWTNKEKHLLDDFTVANELSNEVRVLCWIMTTAENHKSKALHVKNTWGRRCNKLLFMSNVEDSDLDSIGLNITDDHDHLWGKTKLSFEYIYKQHLYDYDWFLKADDDTYVIVENLRYLLHQYSTEDPIYFGSQFQVVLPSYHFHQIYMSGGAGYVLSREAVRRLVERAIPNGNICLGGDLGPEDVVLGYCLSHVNVSAVDTRDSTGRERFFPFEPTAHLVPSPNDNASDYWYIKYSVHEIKDGLKCCSNNAVSFHYVKPSDMYVLDYLIYSLQPYGIVRHPQILNRSLTERKESKSDLKKWSQYFFWMS
ncbi:glycoprotein-N-acetylgalactosamine 3-beta-galactosyltransferase 1-like isoform X2 [Bradysia coprophila]|uniref:glycoprotein-N-acetylgalactosamine 3-beta-galactosyltransferase 1-like isoform X2 n=1 Tax=Bradysia coprophila TaxID=38358 RepID=UPI00187D85F0|nr:glycoprotein-N-acetylgalactosamine 3-beta-galactosyltransferase 1-like isoform X2 [Bradysia coprophila]